MFSALDNPISFLSNIHKRTHYHFRDVFFEGITDNGEEVLSPQVKVMSISLQSTFKFKIIVVCGITCIGLFVVH